MNYLYNGIELPALPEWDKETYPYAVIRPYTSEETTYYTLYVAKEYSTTATYLKLHGYASYECRGESWDFVSETDDTMSWFYSSYKWSNFDIEYNGTVKLAASSPIPVSAPDPQSLLMGYLVGCRL